MKTSEFIKMMEGYGYAVENYNNVLCFILEDVVMTIYTDEFGAIDTQWADFHKLDRDEQEDILEIAFTYIMTPVEEREEPKKYYLRLPDNFCIGNSPKYLNKVTSQDRYFFSDFDMYWKFAKQFTQEEIENTPHKDFFNSLIKEEVKEENEEEN